MLFEMAEIQNNHLLFAKYEITSGVHMHVYSMWTDSAILSHA